MTLFTKSAIPHVAGEIPTVIGAQTVMRGSISAQGSIHIHGEMEGDITEAQEVIIGKGGRLRGNIAVERVEVAGQVVGDIVSSARFELKAGGKVTGDIRSPKILIEEGSIFEGNCAMSETDNLQPPPPATTTFNPKT